MTKKEKIELLKSIDRKADYEINVDGKKKIMNGKRLIAFIISQLKVLIKKLEENRKLLLMNLLYVYNRIFQLLN